MYTETLERILDEHHAKLINKLKPIQLIAARNDFEEADKILGYLENVEQILQLIVEGSELSKLDILAINQDYEGYQQQLIDEQDDERGQYLAEGF